MEERALLQSGIKESEWRQWRNEPATQAFITYLKSLVELSQEAMTGVVMHSANMEQTFALTNRLAGEQKTLFTILDSIAEAVREDEREITN